MGDVPNLQRRFRAVTALLDTDWYFPAHPWHCVLELPRLLEPGTVSSGPQLGDEVIIPAGEPLCRLTPVRRGSYSAEEMEERDFAKLFKGGQRWLEEHGRPSEDPEAGGAFDITGAFAKQQRIASFQVEASRRPGSRNEGRNGVRSGRRSRTRGA
mmetsp:Transcript_77173/g.173161  ORF Transcript_77173/g.173161 Transcript_77173/m.173161 type:complete len:155 (+) Transcript_77173:301-765(+)